MVDKKEKTDKIGKKIKEYLDLHFLMRVGLGILIFVIGFSIIIAILKFLVGSILHFGKYGGIYSKAQTLGIRSYDSTSPSPVKHPIEIASYDVSIKTKNKEEVINKIKSKEDYKTIIIERINSYGDFAFLRVKVKRSEVKNFIAFLKNFDIEDINSNLVKKDEYFSNINEKIVRLEERKRELMNRLSKIKSDYEELIVLAKEKGDVKTLNEIYQSLNNIENNILREINNIEQQIENLKNQQIRLLKESEYVVFSIRIKEDKIIDFEKYKEDWKRSLKEIVNNFSITLNWLSLGLINYLLIALRVVVYVILTIITTLLTLKFVWIIGRKIIKK